MKHILKKLLAQFRGEQNLTKLIDRGLKIGVNFKRMEGVIIDPSHCWHITIGDNVIMAPRVHILAHDASTKLFLDYTRVANVVIGNNVFLGAGTIVLPGVRIGDNVVIGAGSIVSKDIPSNSIAAGTPAKVISDLSSYLTKQRLKMNYDNCFDESFTLRNPEFNSNTVELLNKACLQQNQIFVK